MSDELCVGVVAVAHLQWLGVFVAVSRLDVVMKRLWWRVGCQWVVAMVGGQGVVVVAHLRWLRAVVCRTIVCRQ